MAKTESGIGMLDDWLLGRPYLRRWKVSDQGNEGQIRVTLIERGRRVVVARSTIAEAARDAIALFEQGRFGGSER